MTKTLDYNIAGTLSKKMYIRANTDGSSIVNVGYGYLNLTKTFTNLINGIAEKKTIKDLLIEMCKENPLMDADDIKKILLDKLYYLSNNRIINIDLEGIIMNQNDVFVGEAQYKETSVFLKSFVKNQKNFTDYSFIYTKNPSYYDLVSLRSRSFNYSENYFVMRNNEGSINTLLAIAGYGNNSKNVVITTVIAQNDDEFIKLFSMIKDFLIDNNILKIKLCKFYRMSGSEKDIFEKVGLEFEAKLVSEEKGRDVYIYSNVVGERSK